MRIRDMDADPRLTARTRLTRIAGCIERLNPRLLPQAPCVSPCTERRHAGGVGGRTRPRLAAEPESGQRLAVARSAMGYSNGPALKMCDASAASLRPSDPSAVWEIVVNPFSQARQDGVLGSFLPTSPDWADGN